MSTRISIAARGVAATVFGALMFGSSYAYADPDVSTYANASVEDYTVTAKLSQHLPPRTYVVFKTNGVVCVIGATHEASCDSLGGSAGFPAGQQEARVQGDGPGGFSPYGSFGSAAGQARTLPPGHKITVDRFPDPDGRLSDEDQAGFAQNPITCGVGDGGSVSCETGSGHGFVITPGDPHAW